MEQRGSGKADSTRKSTTVAFVWQLINVKTKRKKRSGKVAERGQRDHGIRYDVCSVESATNTDFENESIDLLAGEQMEPNNGQEAKVGRHDGNFGFVGLVLGRVKIPITTT
jgi:hypothetical protein